MQRTTLEDRIEILESHEKGEETWRIARRMGWQKRTIQKWRLKGGKGGRAGLKSQMGRPAKGALSSLPKEVSETLRCWRLENPGWGPTTLLAELKRHPAFEEMDLPSRTAIGRFLSDEGLVGRRMPSVSLPASERIQVESAHQVWEMDARGYEKIPDVGFVTLIDLNDRFSHVRLLSYPCYLGQERVERHAKTEDYQAALRTAFMEWGMPDALQVDHDSIFYNNKSKSPFPTRFHLWLIALGISLSFIRPKQPEDQGMTERSHQLWYQQVIQGHTFPEWSSLYDALHKRLDFLNQHLPCRSLGGKPPLAAHPDAVHSGRHYHLNFEEEMLQLHRIYAYLQHGRWFRQVSQSGTVSLGGHVYSVGYKLQQHQLEISFDADSHKLLFFDEAGSLISTKELKGFSKSLIMGDISDLSLFAPFQLALPFSWEQQRDARLYGTIS
ncbi:MAG: integrase core domain-containing protein [Chloroflexota bacterium]